MGTRTMMKVMLVSVVLVAILALSDAASSSSAALASAASDKCGSYIGSDLNKMTNTGSAKCASGVMCRFQYSKTGNTVSIVQGCDTSKTCPQMKVTSGNCRSSAGTELYCSNNPIPFTKGKKPYTSCPQASGASSMATLSLFSVVAMVAAFYR